MADSELDKWAAENVAANCTRKSIVDAAVRGGNTVESIYKSLAKAYISTKKNPWPTPGSVKISFSMDEPNVLAIDNLLSAEECQQIIDISNPKLQRSTVLEGTGPVVHTARTSSGCWLYSADGAIVDTINARISEKFNWPQESTEEIQVLKYGIGEQYVPHNDYFSNPNIKQRSATLIMYLQEPEEGGSTYFPESGMHFYPRVGSAVLFTYAGNPQLSKTLHGGSPVLRGTKYIATKWFKVIN